VAENDINLAKEHLKYKEKKFEELNKFKELIKYI